jgi:hypothetical protein
MQVHRLAPLRFDRDGNSLGYVFGFPYMRQKTEASYGWGTKTIGAGKGKCRSLGSLCFASVARDDYVFEFRWAMKVVR